MSLNLTEAQILWDAVNDPSFHSAMSAFFEEEQRLLNADLVRQVKRSDRDTHKESFIVGQIDHAEKCLSTLQDFAARSIKEAKQ